MKRTRRQNGFVLLLVVAMIPLLGIAAFILTSNSRQLITQTRFHAVAVDAELACESGVSWLQTRGADAVTGNEPVILHIDGTDKSITCRIELADKTAEQSVFTVTGTARDRRFSQTHSQRYILKHSGASIQ